MLGVSRRQVRKIQDVVVPSFKQFNKLTSSDDAHILLQIDGLGMAQHDWLGKNNIDNWNDLRKSLRLTHAQLALVQDKVQEWLQSKEPPRASNLDASVWVPRSNSLDSSASAASISSSVGSASSVASASVVPRPTWNSKRKNKVVSRAERYLAEYPDWLRCSHNFEFWCEPCHQHPWVAPHDKLARCKAIVSKPEKFNDHAKHPMHIAVMDLVSSKTQLHKIDELMEDLLVDSKTLNLLHAITWMVSENVPLSKCASLLSFLSHHLDVPVPHDHTSDPSVKIILKIGAGVLVRFMRDHCLPNQLVKYYFPKGIPFGFIMDGSQNRAQHENEAMRIRSLSSSGLPYEMFFEQALLDLSKSDDGESPDASALTACAIENLLTLQRDSKPPLIHNNSWTDALVGTSLDGTDVNLGRHNGLAKRLSDMCRQQVTVHAAAHVSQLCGADALNGCTYWPTFKRIVTDVISEYRRSGKKKFQLQQIAKLLDDADVLSLGSLNGIRWVASIHKLLLKLLRMLPIFIVDLQTRGKAIFGSQQKNIKTPPDQFIGSVFIENKKKFRVIGVVAGQVSDAMTRFQCKATRGQDTTTLSKMELLAVLDDGCDIDTWEPCCVGGQLDICSRCRGSRLWELQLKLRSCRFLLFLTFTLDHHSIVKKVSLAFQSEICMVGSLADEVQFAISNLQRLGRVHGPLERKFRAYMEGTGGLWQLEDTVQVTSEGDGSDLDDHEADRLQICADMAGAFHVRYASALDHPVISAFGVFEHRRWPAYVRGELNGGRDLELYGINDVTLLLDNFATFFVADENEQALSQWTRLKCLVQKDDCLRSLEFGKLWPRILTGFREYNIINRLIAIMVILPVDTSGCERQFSLMNRIMGKWQTRMSHETLRNCMVWHEANKHLSPDLWKLALAEVQC